MVKEHTYLVVAQVENHIFTFEKIKISKRFYEDEEFLLLLKNKMSEKLPLSLRDYPINIINIINLTKIKPVMEE